MGQFEDFFETLPEDQYSSEEETLRIATVDFLEKWYSVAGQQPALTENLGMDPAVRDAKKALLPEKMPLRTWCERRMGQDVEFFPLEKNGRVVVGFLGQLDPADLEHI